MNDAYELLAGAIRALRLARERVAVTSAALYGAQAESELANHAVRRAEAVYRNAQEMVEREVLGGMSVSYCTTCDSYGCAGHVDESRGNA